MNITRFFEVQKEDYNNGKIALKSNKDLLALDVLIHAVIIHEFDKTYLAHTIIPQHVIDEIVYQTGLKNPLSIEAVTKFGLENIYRGEDYTNTPISGVFYWYPDLEGIIIKIDDNGNEYEEYKLTRNIWGAPAKK